MFVRSRDVFVTVWAERCGPRHPRAANGRVAGGRSVGRAGRCGGAAALSGWLTFGRAAERERGREREIYSYGEIDRRLRGEERVSPTPPLIWTTQADALRTLDRARASPGHHHLSIQERRSTWPSDGA